MRRYQTRAAAKDWHDPGPDLLRKLPHAIGAAVAILKRREVYSVRVVRPRKPSSDWRKIGRRRKVRDYLEHRLPTLPAGASVQIACHGCDDELRAVVRAREVIVPDLVGATVRTEVTNALYEAAFPASVYAGALVCKRVDGVSPPLWSDHAYGDAVDRTQRLPDAPNDAMTDWGARMARAGEMPVAQILGSHGGIVVEARRRLFGSWALKPAGASSSHLWHVHNSCVEHHGKPTPECAR